jgi:hypothetical protein
MRTFNLRLALVAGVILLATTLPVAVTASTGVRATLDGNPASITKASEFNCHDRDYPVLRCFTTVAALEADEANPPQSSVLGLVAPLTGPCIRAYKDQNYGGSRLDMYGDVSSFGTYGFNDAISSYQSVYSNSDVTWFDNNSYGGVSWTWPAGSNLLYVGSGANDRFSSAIIWTC